MSLPSAIVEAAVLFGFITNKGVKLTSCIQMVIVYVVVRTYTRMSKLFLLTREVLRNTLMPQMTTSVTPL